MNKLLKLQKKLQKQQVEIVNAKVAVIRLERARNEMFQALQQNIYGFQKGDLVEFQGIERDFKGKFDGYVTDNEEFNPFKTQDQAEVLAWFTCDGNRYNAYPNQLRHSRYSKKAVMAAKGMTSKNQKGRGI